MPWAHRHNLVLTVSASTAAGLQPLGVDRERIRMLNNGVAPRPPDPRSAEPMFLALGRLADYKRIDLLLRLWDRVRPVVGGRLVIAGDGPERGASRRWPAGSPSRAASARRRSTACCAPRGCWCTPP